jgi:hypothetical protein
MYPNRSFFLPILQSCGTVTLDRREQVRFVLSCFFDPISISISVLFISFVSVLLISFVSFVVS